MSPLMDKINLLKSVDGLLVNYSKKIVKYYKYDTKDGPFIYSTTVSNSASFCMFKKLIARAL